MLKLKGFIKSALVLALLVCVSAVVVAGGPEGDKSKSRIQKGATNDHYMAILINNVFNYYANDGDGSLNPYTSDNEGFEFPKGTTGADVIFEDGLVWGGFVNYPGGVKTLKVGGSTYYHGLQAGKITTYGVNGSGMVAESPSLPKNRMFRVRPDIGPSTNESDPAMQAILNNEFQYIVRFETDLTTHTLYLQYIKDWNEWPAADGAPYKDVNGNGVYDPGTDIPGVPGADQTLWYVANDLDGTRTQNIGGVTPIGLEQQTTIWAYNRSGALSSAIFQKYKIINKSGTKIDSMFFCKWSDPDLGGALGAGDDFVGCDIALNMGYVYNGTDNDGFYGKACPAGGFTFFEGPRVPGLPTDSAYFDGKVIHGYKNLKMTTFNMFINGNPTYADPPRNSINATLQWYNLLNGLVGITGAKYIDAVTGLPTKFVMSGDPVKKSGWIEGRLAPPGDRRLCIVSGYISMAAGDTQEVVVSNLAAVGSDRFASVALLKFYSTFGQVAFNNNFDLATPPASPHVTATALDGAVVIDWGDPVASALTEGQNFKGYTFEGYNVYQLKSSSPSLDGAKLLQVHDKVDGVGFVDDLTFDAASGTTITKSVQFGTDFGLQRYYTTAVDAFTNTPLVDGHPYYYAVTAYNYNGTTFPKTLESPPSVLTVIPQAPTPGTVLNSKPGDNIATAAHTTATGPASEGSILARVVDPTKVTGHLYVIKIKAGVPKTWSVYDSTAQVTKLSNISVYGDDPILDPVVDGVQYAVLDPGAAGGFKDAQLIKDGATDYSSAPKTGFIHAKNPGGTWYFDILGSTSAATAYARMGASLEGSHDYEMRFTAAGSGYYAANFTVSSGDARAATRLPFECWDITVNKQLIPAIRDADGDGNFTVDRAEGPGPTSGITTFAAAVWDAIYVQDPASLGYYTEPIPAAAAANSSGFAFRRIAFLSTDTSQLGAFPVPVGTVIRLITNKPLGPTNTFVLNTATAAPVTGSTDAAKATVKQVNVWPNPYYGFNSLESNKYVRFVTITHLPSKATIRIFALSGVLVRTLLHNDPSQFHTWDLNNEAGLPVAAGMYLIHVDMPDLGTSKILKLGVIPEMQFLDRY